MSRLIPKAPSPKKAAASGQSSSRSRRRRIIGLASAGLFVAILLAVLVAPAAAGKAVQPMLTGQVTGAGSLPLHDVHVQVLSGSMVVAKGETNRDGQYRVRVPAGTYDVTFDRKTYEPLTSSGVVVIAPSTTLDAALTQLPMLTGLVTGADDLPLRGVHVQVLSGSTVVAKGHTNRDGQYEVFVPAGTYDVGFCCKTYEPLTSSGVVVTGPSTTLDAALTRLPMLTGVVTGADDLPLREVHVQVLSGSTVVAKGETDWTGQYQVFVPAGTYDVKFCSKTYEPLTSSGVVVTGPSTTLDAALTRLPMLTGMVTGAGSLPLDDVHVRVMSGSTVVAKGETDSSGQYEVFVPAGTYDVVFCIETYEILTDLGIAVAGPSTTLDAALTPLP